jgi:aryl-alcohol dehydrogenase-like predicted oxidoreductase
MLRTISRSFSSVAKIPGFATSEGTEKYTYRSEKVLDSHFRLTYATRLTISSLGIGTYIGAPDEETDKLVERAIIDAVETGAVNVIDTAINYRYQKAERSVGRAVREIIERGLAREELVICSKIGYIPEDADKGVPGMAVINQLKKDKAISDEDVVGRIHCMHPAFLKDQLDRSLDNLGLETLDLMYLHNAAESQMPEIGAEKFLSRLGKAFEFFEQARSENKIKSYGLATWIAFRSPVEEAHLHLSLEKVVKLAEQIGGPNHGMRYIQLPVNLIMPEAFVQKWQEHENSTTYFLNVAKHHNINVITSSPLLQGKLLDLKLSKTMLNVEPQGAKHIQLVRSIPSDSIKTVLVGMKNPRNVTQNIQLAYSEPLTKEDFWNYLKPEGKEDKAIVIDLW